ncbi:hypothetical protein NLJ89_g11302 [Agrocybe chaxingu]|uniref:non-specific serine/threonine protein kinase n=1 Tax=Agrocybe chaxingu TaxID=84603 RepID=A0A9W8JX11_9AGAR|nr:hypothetical protein NLJ89_g11302 [Agrocybe chaxingu]
MAASPSAPQISQAEKSQVNLDSLDIHRGAIDQTTITTEPPTKVMKRVNALLQELGVQIQEETPFRYRCIRAKKVGAPTSEASSEAASQSIISGPNIPTPPQPDAIACTLYGSLTEDPADEVRFTVELTRLAGLNDTYSLDVRRLKGNLRSYKFVYDTIRERAELNRA